MKRLVVGLLAHVDSGKTTLAEGLLYTAGEIRKAGRVDHKNAFLDTHDIERDRGITIFSKQAVLHYKDMEITLLDTPGHVDFSTEMERTLCVLDYAILVISASEGVQSHTETLWRLLRRYQIPTFLFVNKMDIAQTDASVLIKALQQKLSANCIDFTLPENHDFFESLAMCDERILQQFLDTDRVEEEEICRAVKKRNIFPCYFGAALKMQGMEALLDALNLYTRQQKPESSFGAEVFKIAEDAQGNRLTHMKIIGGSLKVRTQLSGKTQKGEVWQEKVHQIRIYSGSKFETTEEAHAGTVCAVTGLTKTYAGEGIGVAKNAKGLLLEPVLTYRALFPPETDLHKAYINLRQLEQEDPQLHVVWNAQLQEIHVQLMGEVQLEVLRTVIAQRFKTQVDFDQGSIAYKETIAEKVEGIGHYEPLRHYAEVHLILEPIERGAGIQFETECSEDVLDRNWQRLILTHLAEKTHIGVLTGSPITDIKITLASGKAHLKHTEGGDFRQATYRAVRQGLMSAESILLEPWYDFRLEIPADNVGRAMTDIQQMGGNFEPPEQIGEMSVLMGAAPVAQMQNYHSEVIGYTKGKGKLFCMLKGYEPCRNPEEVIEKMQYQPEKDLENTADSVFCAHGAGFTVKWNQVPEYAHLENVLKPRQEPEEVTPAQVNRYIQRVAADKELMQIFERTYGPIRKSYPDLLHTPKQTTASNHTKPPKGKPQTEGPEYVLVDGYNVIFAWEELKKIAETSLEMARDRLIDTLCNYRAFRDCELIVVFDAYKVKNNPGEHEIIHDVHVVYTKEAETADMYIEKATHELGRKHRVRVVTSDNLEQLIILGSGALRIPADAFLQEIQQAQQAVRKFLSKE